MFTFELPEFTHDLALLLVRIVVAIAFFYQSFLKLKDIKAFSKNDGIPVPVSWFVAFAELAAALSFLTGFMTQWAAIGVIVLMLGTISLYLFVWHSKYWAQKGGWEYDIIMIVFSAVILAFGAGSWALTWPWS